MWLLMQLEVYTAVAALEHSQFFPMLPAGLTLAATPKKKTFPGPAGAPASSSADQLGSVTARSPLNARVLNLYVSHKYIFLCTLKKQKHNY